MDTDIMWGLSVSLSVSRFIVGFLFLFVASIMDLKTRRIPNELWMIMSGFAVVLLFLELFTRGVSWEFYLIFIPIAVLLAEAFIDRPPLYKDGNINFPMIGWFALPIASLIFQIYTLHEKLFFWSLMTIPIIMAVVFGLYFFYIIYGGADAKALIVIALLVPLYPHIPYLTHMAGSELLLDLMQIFFPFTLVVMLNASLLSLSLPVSFIFKNIGKGDIRFPEMVFGYRKKVDEIQDSFAWPMEYYDDGEHVVEKLSLRPKKDPEEAIQSLKDHDVKTAWVKPKIPFIVFIFLGFVLSFIIGNPMIYIVKIF
ncbi:MAG: A24 family peptidase C-terminal domain-containing protein [Thermoplasmatota archaeon]